MVTLVQQLRHLILSGDIAPGSRLQLEDLRQRFGVSLSPLREALSRLTAEGFVEGRENRGFHAADVSRENLFEITQLRAELEAMALAAAIRRGDDEWEERLVAVFHRLTKLESTQATHQIDAWEIAHREFHLTLVSACGTPLLPQFCTVLHDQNDRYRRIFLKHNPPQRDVAREHKAILEAVLARDAELASERVRKHVTRTGRIVQAAMPD